MGNYSVFGHLTLKNHGICSGFCFSPRKNIVNNSNFAVFSCFSLFFVLNFETIEKAAQIHNPPLHCLVSRCESASWPRGPHSRAHSPHLQPSGKRDDGKRTSSKILEVRMIEWESIRTILWQSYVYVYNMCIFHVLIYTLYMVHVAIFPRFHMFHQLLSLPSSGLLDWSHSWGMDKHDPKRCCPHSWRASACRRCRSHPWWCRWMALPAQMGSTSDVLCPSVLPKWTAHQCFL